jgi:oligopeptide transport system substrate-binding protein
MDEFPGSSSLEILPWSSGERRHFNKRSAQQQAVQQQLEAADVNPDQKTRLQEYNQAEQQLVNDVAWMPIEQVRVPNLLKPCVKGVVFNASGVTPPDDWGNVYISTDTPCSNPT